MRKKMYTAAFGLALLGVLATGSAMAQQQVQARVVSTAQVTEPNGRVGYNVTYEYEGRQYSTYTDSQPGRTIAVDVGAYGVTTTPVAPQAQLSGEPVANGGRAPWEGVVPEQGVVVSSARPAAPTYYAAPAYPAPVYMAPAPVYVAPAYGYGYGYGYAPAYAYPPIGLSLNLGYSRGWGGHRGRWR